MKITELKKKVAEMKCPINSGQKTFKSCSIPT